MSPDNRPIFIVGTPRAATKTAAAVFETVPGLEVYHENAPLSLLEVKGGYLGRQSLMPVAQSRLKAVQEAAKRGKRYVESYYLLSLLITHLRWYMPGARFLWMIRDPIKFIQSGYNREWYGPRDKEVQGKWADARLAPRPTDPFRDNWGMRPRLVKLAWLWRAFNAEIFAQLAMLPRDEWNPVFVHDIRHGWEQRFIWLGLPYDKKAVDEVLKKQLNRTLVKDKKLGPPESWPARQREQVEEIVNPLMGFLVTYI